VRRIFTRALSFALALCILPAAASAASPSKSKNATAEQDQQLDRGSVAELRGQLERVDRELSSTTNASTRHWLSSQRRRLISRIENRTLAFTFAPSIDAAVPFLGDVEAQLAFKLYFDAYRRARLQTSWALLAETFFGSAGFGRGPDGKYAKDIAFEFSGVSLESSPVWGRKLEVGIVGSYSGTITEYGEIVAGGIFPIFGVVGPGLELGVRHESLGALTRPVIRLADRVEDWVENKTAPARARLRAALKPVWTPIKDKVTRVAATVRRKLPRPAAKARASRVTAT
jgi:hypothetical protein